MQTNQLNKKETLTILQSLSQDAENKTDPKPRLRALQTDSDTARHAAKLLAACIEELYSQASALERLQILEPKQIEKLRSAEGNGTYAAAYKEIIAEIEGKTETFRFSTDDILELGSTILQNAGEGLSKTLEKLRNTATSQTLKKVAPSLLEAITKDGKEIFEGRKRRAKA